MHKYTNHKIINMLNFNITVVFASISSMYWCMLRVFKQLKKEDLMNLL